MPHTGHYRFLLCDLLTNALHFEPSLYGVSFGRLLNKAGNGTFSLNLDRTGFNNRDVLEATTPGKTALYIERNGGLIWGGIVWSRTYQAQAKALSFTTQTFESFFYKSDIETSLAFVNREQRNILVELIDHMQHKDAFSNIGVNVPLGGLYPFSPDVLRSVEFFNHQLWSYGKAIDYMIEFDLGFDYTIEVAFDANMNPSKYIRTDNVLGASLQNTGLVFQYPGNIKNYYWPENASRGAASTIGSGAGEGTGKLLTKVTEQDLLDAGYPNLQEIYSNTDVSLLPTLVSQTTQASVLNRIPITVPTFELNSTQDPAFGTWALGDHAKIEITDARFPDGLKSDIRIIGYQASPTTSEGPEEVTLVIAGGDDQI